MPVSDLFMQQIQPGLAAFTNFQPPPAPSLVPGVVNTGGAPAPPIVMTGPPPPTVPTLDGGASVPPPMASQVNMSVQPPAPPPPEQPTAPDMRPVMSTVGGSPAHEVMKAGPTQIALLNRAEQVKKDSIYDQAEAAQKAAKAEYTQAEKGYEAAQQQIQGAQAAQADEQARIQAAQQHIDQASAPLNKPIEDYWSDKDVGTKALTALSLVAGAVGAAFSKTGQNVGMQLFQQAVDQDMRTKQMNYQRQLAVKDRAQQDFNNLVNQIGMNPAKEQYKAALQSKGAAQLQMIAANNKIPEAQANASKAAAELEASALERKATALMGYQQATKGQKMILDPVLGVPVSAEKYGEYKMKGALEGQQQEGQLRIAEAKEGRSKVDEGTKFIAGKLQESKIPSAMAAIDKAASTMTPSADNPDAREGLGRTGAFIRENLGESAYKRFYSQNALNREQTWKQATAEVMHSLGGVLSKDEFARYDSMLRGADTAEDRANTLALIRERLNAQVNTIKAGAGPEASAAYESNLRAVTPPKIQSKPVK